MPLPPAFNRLAWSNLAAQSAEQVGLAAALGFLVQAVVIVASPVLRLTRQPEMVG